MQGGFITMVGMVAGVLGTGLGATAAFLFKRDDPKVLSFLLNFAAALMIAVVCFDLLPEAIQLHSLPAAVLGLIAGALGIMVLDILTRGEGDGFLHMGYMMLLGIAAHNFPEGLAIGAGYAHAPAMGLSLALLIAIHDVPEGMAIGIPLKKGRVSFLRVLGYGALSGAPTGVGALIGYLAGSVSPLQISLCMGIAGGAMLYLTLTQLIPKAHTLYGGPIGALGLLLGLIVGTGVSVMLT